MTTYEEEQPTQHVVIDNKLQKRNLEGWTRSDKIALILALLLEVLLGVYGWGGDPENIGVAVVYVMFASVPLKWLLSRSRNSFSRRYATVGHLIGGWRLMKRGGHHHGPMPLHIAVINARDQDGIPYRIPLQHHLDRPCDQLLIRGRGGAFASLMGLDLYQRNQLLADVFDRSLSMTDLDAGIACLYVSTPVSDADFVLEMGMNGNPLLMAPENFVVEPGMQKFVDLQNEYLNQLPDAFRAKGARETWGLIVVTIHHGGGWKGIKKDKLDNDELDNLAVLELGRSLVDGLKASELLGLSDVQILKPTQHYRLVRASWDVFGIGPFNDVFDELDLKYKAKTIRELAEIQNASEEALTALQVAEVEVNNDRLMLKELQAVVNIWPEEIVSVSDQCLRMDNNYITVIRIDETPKEISEDEYLSQLRLIPLGEWARRCYGGEAISGDGVSTAILVQQVQTTSWLDTITDNLSFKIPKLEAFKQELRDKSQTASRYSIAQLSSKYWALVAPSEQLSKARTKKFIATLRARGFKSRVVKRPVLHVDAFLTAALGAARM